MKFLPIHTEALRYFGYTEEESRFLYLVATHSGYFTCQQFLQFIKMKPGKRSVAFGRKVVEKGHASSKEYLRHGRVFHLFSRNLYEAVGRENARFRRVHSTEYIRTRLIALDFILRNQDFTYLESEEQKLSFFCDQLGIDKKILPHKRYSGAIKNQHTDRYFVDKFPMFYHPGASLPPVMTFSFIDPGFESMDSFRTHLDAYLTFFTKLPKLHFYYVATRDTNFERAKKLFHRTFQRLWNPTGPRGLFDYFRTRRTWDEKNYGKLSEHDILFMNQGKERFSNPGMENLYQRWRAGEITENTVRSESVNFQRPSQVTFICATVNGQTALFERHPHQPLSAPGKSSEATSFSGDFTPEITLAWG
ncbi:MAG TPA: hypothetical protein VJY15_24995 [Candidatus Acidoferrum sp.]|nr:hypothetical protein [Candidatus Acidoferrum sp.]